MRSLLLTFLLSLSYLSAFSQPCLPDGITFTSQAEIDNFPLLHPDCTEIGGDVKVGHITPNSDITNLDGLSAITKIDGSLFIRFNDLLTDLGGLDVLDTIAGELHIRDNANLLSLSGLDNLVYCSGGLGVFDNLSLTSLQGIERLSFLGQTFQLSGNSELAQLTNLNYLDSIAGSIFIMGNSNLSNLAGLDSLTYVGGSVDIGYNLSLINASGLDKLSHIKGDLSLKGHTSMTSLEGLESLEAIEGDFWLESNDLLVSLSGLNSLKSIDGFFWIYSNKALTNFSGLDSLLTINGDMEIYGNNALTELTGLNSIESNSIDNLWILQNSSLSKCEVQSVCDYLNNPMGDVSIGSNASGCDSVEQVLDSCQVVSIEKYESNGSGNSFMCFPNPVSKQLTLEFTLLQTSDVHVVIFDQLGDNVWEFNAKNQQPGKRIVYWDLSHLLPGIYFCTFNDGDRMKTTKVVKLE